MQSINPKKTIVMKKILSYVACLLIVTSVAAAPSSKILQAFNATFPNAKNVKWSDDKADYFVSFYQNENFEKVLYSKEGDFVCSWKDSDGKDLPTNISMTLNKKYNADKILGVTEVTNQNNVSYEIKLTKGDKMYAVTMLSDGSISKEQKFDYQN